MTKETYEIMSQFERDAKQLIRTGSQGFKREDKEQWIKGYYYTDGVANEAFRLYYAGVSFGKTLNITEP